MTFYSFHPIIHNAKPISISFKPYATNIGIPLASEKTCGPATTLSFAGIELDTIKSEARLPTEQIAKCVQSKTQNAGSYFVSVKKFSPQNGGHVRTFCAKANGNFLRKSKMADYCQIGPLSRDRARILYLIILWKWPNQWLHRNIAILEFYPIVLSVCLWGHKIQNHRILFFTDNESLVHVIKKKSRMFFVRKLVLACLKYNILFKAKHIPGIHNKLADCLSRFQVQTFKQLAPVHMNRFPTDIPPHLLPRISPIQLRI